VLHPGGDSNLTRGTPTQPKTPAPGDAGAPGSLPAAQGALYSRAANSPGKEERGKAECRASEEGGPRARCPPGPSPALTGLVVVVDPDWGRLQAPHGDVPLHREGEAEGLAAQLWGEAAGAEGRLRAAAGSLAVP